MKDKIFGVIKHSAFYSVGNIALKGMGIITLPIYANYLSQSEFGFFGILDVTIGILAEVLTLGQANSIILFSGSRDYKERKQSAFFTITIFVLLINFIFVAAAELAGGSIISSFNSAGEFSSYLSLIVFITLTRVINTLFLNKLRAEEKSLSFTFITLIKIILFVVLIFITVVHLKLSVSGIMYSYLISEIAITVILFPIMIKEMEFKFDAEILKRALRFGFPLIFTTIGIMILNLSDRYLINYYLDLKSVGVYDFGYRIAGAINMFLLLPFNQALLPSAIKEYGKPGDKRYYSKLMTYMSFISVWGGFSLALFSREIILILGNKEYLNAEIFVPLIIAAYIFSGKRNIASTGFLLAEKTSYIAVITLGAAVFNIVLNIIFIPMYGIIAAAYTTLISFVVFFIVTKILADRFYSIPYEAKKIVVLFIAGGIYFLSFKILEPNNLIISWLFRIALIISFPFVLHVFGFYEKIELETIKSSFIKLSNPLEIKNIISRLLKDDSQN